jgi:NADPH-dependent 2,4-dienoyl-CoA reductase/sulfur reductase-like enzyme
MPERLVVIGGDAGGMGAATQARRGRPDLEIIALERGRWTSYSACGIPYVVGGDVAFDDLVVRTPEEHQRLSNIEVRTQHEVLSIDVPGRRVEVRDIVGERTYWLDFDMLHLGLGAVPIRPDLPGMHDAHVHGVQTLEDARELLDDAQGGSVKRVVVVGAGYIGLEIAEAFVKRGCPSVTVVTRGPEVMNTLDPDMGALVSEAMRGEGIDVRCGTDVVGFDGRCVETSDGSLEADLVVLGLGVAPNTALVREAGIAVGVKEAVRVDLRQRTSAEGVWAAGDCCESFHLVARAPVHIALGTHANKMARVAGTNMGGGYATFPGVVGTAVTKLCATEVARTGLTEREASAAGFAFEAVTVDSTTRAGYFPGAAPIKVKVLAERQSGRLLGAQIVGKEGAAKRIDVLATALTAQFTVEEMTALDLSYAPPFAPVWDPVLIAARKASASLASLRSAEFG